jgi:hypothetical protein
MNMHPVFNDYVQLLNDLYQGFEEAIKGLSVEALDWTPGPDMNSLCVLIVHTTGATRFLVGDVITGISSNRDRPAEFRASGLAEAALKVKLAESKEFVRGVLDTLTPDDLTKTRFMPERNKTYTYAEAILHALEHIGLHVGHAQITRQLWDQQQK